MKLVQEVERAVRHQKLLEPGMRVAVACSGGADSVALLRLLDELKERLGLRLLVAHLNHQLRGAESDADEGFVRQLAERLGLECVVQREDVAARAKRNRLNLEEAGRQARMDFFTSLITENKADTVALAHTLDDQAETVLARMVRGAGTRGLAGIYPVVELELGGATEKERVPSTSSKLTSSSKPVVRTASKVKSIAVVRLVRPLLGVRRAALRAYLSEQEHAWREDTSNLDRDRLRNRIRLELLPQLNPAAIKHLGRLATQARQEENVWSALVEDRFDALVSRADDRYELDVTALLTPDAMLARLPARAGCEGQRALARRLLRRTLAAVRGDLRRITQSHVESVLRLAEEGQSGQRVELPRAIVERSFNRLVFRRAQEQAETRHDYQVKVEGPSTVGLPGGGSLSFKLVAVEALESGYNQPKGVADAARTPFPLLVRAWQLGDSYRPAGAARRKKLKTLFREQRIPVEERRRTPVVVCGEEIVWVPRLGVAADCSLGAGSRIALLMERF